MKPLGEINSVNNAGRAVLRKDEKTETHQTTKFPKPITVLFLVENCCGTG